MLQEEFAPVIDFISKGFNKLIGLFGKNTEGLNKTNIALRVVTIAFKSIILPIRLLINNIRFLADSWEFLSNQIKKGLNLLGGDFDIDPNLTFEKAANRFKKNGDIIKSTFDLLSKETKEGTGDLESNTEATEENTNALEKNSGAKGRNTKKTKDNIDALKEELRLIKEKRKALEDEFRLERERLEDNRLDPEKIRDDFANLQEFRFRRLAELKKSFSFFFY